MKKILLVFYCLSFMFSLGAQTVDLSLKSPYRMPPIVYSNVQSQLHFGVEVGNFSNEMATDITINVNVYVNEGLVYNNVVVLESLVGDSTFRYVEFLDSMLISTGSHKVVYTVAAAETDTITINDTISYSFESVGDFCMNLSYVDTATKSMILEDTMTYEVGNFFKIEQNGFQMAKVSADVYSPSGLNGKTILFFIYEVINNGDSLLNSQDLALHGLMEHTFDVEGTYQKVTKDVGNIITGDNWINLEGNTKWYIAIRFPPNQDLYFMYNDSLDYSNNPPTFLKRGSSLEHLDITHDISMHIQPTSYSFPNPCITSNELPIFHPNNIKLFPTVTSDKINVELDIEAGTTIDITISSIDGKIILQDKIINYQQQAEQYDVSTFENGMYLLNVQTTEGFVTKKFIVMK